MTVPAAFTASETFDVGVDLGSPVAELLRPPALPLHRADRVGDGKAHAVNRTSRNTLFGLDVAIGDDGLPREMPRLAEARRREHAWGGPVSCRRASIPVTKRSPSDGDFLGDQSTRRPGPRTPV